MIGYDFILAGKATFTLQGKDARFTYRVSRKENEPGSRFGEFTYYVGLLTGPDNTADYRYLGILDPATGYVRLTRNSKMTESAPAVKAIKWALPLLHAGRTMPPSFSLHHEGRCGRCGRELTVPESIETGIGPDCAAQMGLTQVSKAEAQALAQARNSKKFAEARGQAAPTYRPSDYWAHIGNQPNETPDKTAEARLFAVAFEEAR